MTADDSRKKALKLIEKWLQNRRYSVDIYRRDSGAFMVELMGEYQETAAVGEGVKLTTAIRDAFLAFDACERERKGGT
jgi:hypothetical protein